MRFLIFPTLFFSRLNSLQELSLDKFSADNDDNYEYDDDYDDDVDVAWKYWDLRPYSAEISRQ